MRKTAVLAVAVILLAATAAVCFAAPSHTHRWYKTSRTDTLSPRLTWVAAGSCKKLPYSGHNHFTPRYQDVKISFCPCGARNEEYSSIYYGETYCPN